METDVVVPTTTPDFRALLGVLSVLSRKHLLYFRLRVGQEVAEALFDGKVEAYQDHAASKEGSLRRFAAEFEAELEDLGLSEATLRQCVRGWFLVQELPSGVMDKLGLSHLTELGKVPDLDTRRLLAQAAFDNGWSGAALRDAVKAVADGRWIDGDPNTEGLQPPAPEPEPVRAPQPGRVVARFEQTAEELDHLIGQWEQVAVEKLTKRQQTRVAQALAKWKEKIARLESRLTTR